MQIRFCLPHVFSPESNPAENASALQALLNALVQVNSNFLLYHPVPALYRSGVVYGRTEEWDCIPAVIERGYGDCKSLSAWLVAEYLKKGINAQPVFRFYNDPVYGSLRYHILVQTEKGYEDPSKVLGMPTE